MIRSTASPGIPDAAASSSDTCVDGKWPCGPPIAVSLSKAVILTLSERQALLRRLLGRLFFQGSPLMAEHCGGQLPGWTRRIAPGRRYREQTILAGIRIEVEKSRVAADEA